MARPLAPCGTNSAYLRHIRWGQQPCNACRAAHAATEAKRRARQVKPPRELVPCGRESAYRRHLRRNEVPCKACCEAHTAEIRSYLQRKAAA